MAAAKGKHKRKVTQTEYVAGTAVRKLQMTERQAAERQVPRKQQSHTVTVQRKQTKDLSMDLPYVFLLTIAVICTLSLCVGYLQIQSAITARLDRIEELEKSIETQKADNDALETKIKTSVDLDNIYKIATEELGMVYANKDQVRLYNKTESEYVRQYEDIPQQ